METFKYTPSNHFSRTTFALKSRTKKENHELKETELSARPMKKVDFLPKALPFQGELGRA